MLAAIAAALTVGVLFGTADAIVADTRLYPPQGFLGYLGCYAAAIFSYVTLALVLLGTVAFWGHLVLRRVEPALRFRRLLTLGLTVFLFAEIYWWTRPYVFYGHSSVSPERLVAAAAQLLVAIVLGWAGARLITRLPGAVHSGLRVVGIISILGGLLFIRSEQSLIENRGALNDRNRDLPNVLLVIVDALRADHLACYGNLRVKTPNLDALAQRGVLVESCYAQAPYTLTSFGSILTGKYPRKHGLVAQLPGIQMEPNVTLPFHLKTAQFKGSEERLRDEDYAAGTFMTGAVSHGSGLARGFDAYSEAMMGHDLVQIDSQWSRFRSELLLWLFKNKLQQRVDSSLVVTTARGWLREHRGRRWMAMVHLYSTHTPYDPPGQHREPYLDPTYSGPIQAFYADSRYAIEAGVYEPTEADIEQIRDLYAAGAAQADAMIGELLAELEELGVLEDTLVIVTSDHGEDLGELRPVGIGETAEEVRFWEHNHMWQTNLRIPLIMAYTPALPHGVRLDQTIESVDILPTICDILGLELPTEEGAMEVDGRSFLPAILGEEHGEPSTYEEKRFTYSENNLFFSIQDRASKLIVPRRLLVGEVPEVLDIEDDWVRFYDLIEDPHEADNLYRPEDGRVQELWRALRSYDAAMPVPKYRMTARDQEQANWLKALGYVGGIVAEEDEERGGHQAGDQQEPESHPEQE
jgi:arylsulfatase A-like enzyme